MSARRWSQIALVAALVTGAVLAVAPISRTEGCTVYAPVNPDSPEPSLSDGFETCSSDTESLLEIGGVGTLAILAVPLLIAAAPVVFSNRGMAIAAAVCLTVAVLLGVASLGLFYVPTAALAWFAVATTRRQQPESQ